MSRRPGRRFERYKPELCLCAIRNVNPIAPKFKVLSVVQPLAKEGAASQHALVLARFGDVEAKGSGRPGAEFIPKGAVGRPILTPNY